VLSQSSNARSDEESSHRSPFDFDRRRDLRSGQAFGSVSLTRDCAQDDKYRFGSVRSQVRRSGSGAPRIGGTENGAWNASTRGANRLAARRESVHLKDRFQVSGVRCQ
jgi:hypothetical protein